MSAERVYYHVTSERPTEALPRRKFRLTRIALLGVVVVVVFNLLEERKQLAKMNAQATQEHIDGLSSTNGKV